MLNIIRIFICRNVIGIVFGYFQKLNIIHIFIQSFFKSWILSFFQSRKHYSLISENNSFRILPPIHISRFWTCVSTPMDQRNKQKSMKQSKTAQTFQNGPMWFRVVQKRDVQNAKRLGLKMFCSLLDTTEVFKRFRCLCM